MIREASHLGDELQRTAQEDPARLALSDADEDLTYGEMLAEARALAGSLPGGSADRRPVAMLMPSNARTVVGMFACLIAGRPYCVLNPAQPRRRLEVLLAAIEPSVVWVADPGQRAKLEAVGLPVTEPVGTGRPIGELELELPRRPDDGLSGIYVTSGSSGSPKLVGYRHEATYHRVGQYFAGLPAGGPHDLGSGHRFALASPLWTAGAASAMFAALFRRAELHLLDPGVSKPAALTERVRLSEATVWHSAPSAFRRLAGSGALDGNRFRVVRLTGEPLLLSDVELARRTCGPDAWLIAAYGITETNGIVTQRAIQLDDPEATARPLDSGYPLDGIQVRIENEGGVPLPAGAEGEIVVGGEYLSAGYLDQEEPAGTRFSRRNGHQVFHTGDRGELLADGSLLVKGRADRRVNVRGYLVDPSEVEAATLRLPGVLDAAVVSFRAGEEASALALFATVDGVDSVTPPSLRAHLRQLLQPEAVPALVNVLNALPETPAGKVDRLRLASLAEEGARRKPATHGREDPLVSHLAILWSEALEIGQPGADEDFFALGGDSLAAAEVCTAIEDVYGVALEPATLLDYRSPRALAEHVRGILDGNPHVPTSVLRLNPQGSRPPLFVFPGAGSDATALVHFAEAIGPEQPVNVIQLPGADGRSRPLADMDAIAAYGLSAMEQAGVEPPYRIAGTSFGGLAAFHTAVELQREGRQVSYLGLFDTPAPSTRSGHYLVRPLRHLSRAPNLSLTALAQDPRKWLRRAGRAVRRFFADYRMVVWVLLSLRRSGVEHRFRHLRAGCAIAADRWTPRPLSMPMHLYRCDSQPDHLAGAPRLGWEDLAPDVNVRRLRSRHNRHIRPPNVNQLAALVSEDLDGANTS